jgi:hypothetical protein
VGGELRPRVGLDMSGKPAGLKCQGKLKEEERSGTSGNDRLHGLIHNN